MNLLVSDFDLTFFNDNYKENIKYVKELKNFEFAIATGRNYKFLSEDLKIDCNYYILADGGYVMDKNQKVLYTRPIKDKTYQILEKKLKQLNITNYSFEIFNNDIVKLEIKIEDKDIALKRLDFMLKGLPDLYGYISRNWINIMDKEATKENAVKFLNRLNNYEKIYTVGDGPNDYGMIKEFNGFLISKEKKKGYNTISNFLELKNVI